MMFRWLGVAGIEIEVAGQVLVIDPYLTRPSILRLGLAGLVSDPALVTRHVPRCDGVLITHAHVDHLMDAPELIRQTGAAAYGSGNTCALLRAAGISPAHFHEVRAKDRWTVGGFEIEAIAGKHTRIPFFGARQIRRAPNPPFHLFDFQMDTCLSYRIAAGGVRYLDWAGVSPEGAPPADILFIGAYLQGETLQTILDRTRAHVVVPVHWDNFFKPLSQPLQPSLQPPHLAFPPVRRVDLPGFERTVRSVLPAAHILVPQIFTPYDLDTPATHPPFPNNRTFPELPGR